MFFSVMILLFAYIYSVSGEVRLAVDKDKNCAAWAKQGYCTSGKYIKYMSDSCQKSCGVCNVCTQTNKNCKGWALRGECTKNPKWMPQNCPISCRVCGTCVDMLAGNQCYMGKKMNQCKENKKYMHAWCPCSCGVCSKTSKKTKCTSGGKSYNVGEKYITPNCGAQCTCQKDGQSTCVTLCPPRNVRCKTGEKRVMKDIPVSGSQCTCKTPVCETETDAGTKTRLEIPINEAYCGKRIAKGRVVGGYADSRDNWPWIALMVKAASPDKVWCGASILNAKFALTAAHCFPSHWRINARDWKLRVGMTDLSRKSASEKMVSIKKITLANWNANTFDNDIALLELDEVLFYNRKIKPICLPAQGQQFSISSQCYVGGWGRLSDSGDVSKVLMAAKIPLIDDNTCRNTMHDPPDVITKNMFCGGYKEGGIDACQGDSGGPLICKVGRQFVQVGIVSWGKKCAEKGKYGIYTKLSNYRDWIEQAMMG